VIKGRDVAFAKFQLNHLAKKFARPVLKLLDSAMANAYNNFGLVKENLYVKNIIVDEGTKLKRFRPKGFGSVSPIEKKTSHIRIILDERVPGMKAEKKHEHKEKEESQEIDKIEKSEKKVMTKKDEKMESKKEAVKKGTGTGIKGFGRRLFRRKAI